MHIMTVEHPPSHCIVIMRFTYCTNQTSAPLTFDYFMTRGIRKGSVYEDCVYYLIQCRRGMVCAQSHPNEDDYDVFG